MQQSDSITCRVIKPRQAPVEIGNSEDTDLGSVDGVTKQPLCQDVVDHVSVYVG